MYCVILSSNFETYSHSGLSFFPCYQLSYIFFLQKINYASLTSGYYLETQNLVIHFRVSGPMGQISREY